MDMKQIKEIAKTMNENGLTLIEITEGDTILRLERKAANTAYLQSSADLLQTPVKVAKMQESPLAAVDNTIQIKSPMVGVFFPSASPDSEPYVKIGSRVKKGDTLCVIEAMKLLNEICTERDGEIVDICAADGQTVEYAQVLFKII